MPLHLHLGYACIVDDYVPSRRAPMLNTAAVWALRIVTGLCLYGCFLINTTDVGLTAVFQRLWTGKDGEGKRIE